MSAELGQLLLQMRSESKEVRETAWAACYQAYRDIVWTRVFYVLRTISWLREPREATEDVTSDVFVGLVEAAKQYREEGKPEQWLAQVAVRAALRAREKLTGDWKGRRGSGATRRNVSFEDEANAIAAELDSVDRDELLELERRIAELRSSAEPRHQRWAEFIDLYRDGYGYEEIGKRLSLTEATARNWLVAIRKHLASSSRAANG
ncbi:MAG: sigma-70 family RNA polymerase sigma factor [Gemmatimonadaceae bacterium]|nr:sigma-70 family RNA polymerase sigma factor [Gemmatimonadaceae bacterium]